MRYAWLAELLKLLDGDGGVSSDFREIAAAVLKRLEAIDDAIRPPKSRDSLFEIFSKDLASLLFESADSDQGRTALCLGEVLTRQKDFRFIDKPAKNSKNEEEEEPAADRCLFYELEGPARTHANVALATHVLLAEIHCRAHSYGDYFDAAVIIRASLARSANDIIKFLDVVNNKGIRNRVGEIKSSYALKRYAPYLAGAVAHYLVTPLTAQAKASFREIACRLAAEAQAARAKAEHVLTGTSPSSSQAGQAHPAGIKSARIRRLQHGLDRPWEPPTATKRHEAHREGLESAQAVADWPTELGTSLERRATDGEDRKGRIASIRKAVLS